MEPFLVRCIHETNPYLVEENNKYLWGKKEDAIKFKNFGDAEKIVLELSTPCFVEFKNSLIPPKHRRKQEDRASCGCLESDVESHRCDICQMMSITCKCRPYGSCSCS